MTSKRKQIYLAYLASDHWENLRHEAFKRDNYQCVKCGNRSNLQGHHKRYPSDLETCTVEDILTLCGRCHVALHYLKKQRRKLNRRQRRRIKAHYKGQAAWWRLVHNLPTEIFVIPLYNREDALKCNLFFLERLEIESYEPTLTFNQLDSNASINAPT